MEFRDSNGVEWSVSEVSPAGATAGSFALLPSDYRTGWLAFKSTGERRRLMPYPADWRERSVEELAELCRRARPVPVSGEHVRIGPAP
ncbi:MAG TPA: hypothetical protein VKA84_13500 [Gemmatimonadaceae bacterium]|nr:hypothetical protein [Gemmatimonadaceae bacterium]